MGRELALRRRRAASGSIAALAFAAASFAACLDFGDLSGGDGGVSSTADGGDATSDAPASGDANLDGASANDGEAGTVIVPFVSCAALSPQPALCADFDEGSLLGTAFTSTQRHRFDFGERSRWRGLGDQLRPTSRSSSELRRRFDYPRIQRRPSIRQRDLRRSVTRIT